MSIISVGPYPYDAVKKTIGTYTISEFVKKYYGSSNTDSSGNTILDGDGLVIATRIGGYPVIER